MILWSGLDWITSTKADSILSKSSPTSELTDVFVYVHWSPDMKPTLGEIELLTQTSKNGLQNIVVLNVDFPEAANKYLTNWQGLYTQIILRKNLGRDLAAYRASLPSLNGDSLKRVYFFNNSVLWLPAKMDEFLKTLTSAREDLYSATVSYQPARHMQTFALGAQYNGVKVLLREISKVRNTRLKRSTISYGEIRISKNLSRRKIRFSNGLFQYSGLVERALTKTALISQPSNIVHPAIDTRLNQIRIAVANGTPLNPTHHTWLELYLAGFPGVKKDLFSKNKSRIPDLYTYKQYFEEVDSNLIDMESIGFITSPKSLTDRLRRKLWV